MVFVEDDRFFPAGGDCMRCFWLRSRRTSAAKAAFCEKIMFFALISLIGRLKGEKTEKWRSFYVFLEQTAKNVPLLG